jgi:hypothetical protein
LTLKNARLIAMVAIGLACSAPARAQVFGQFVGAEPLPVNGHLFGAYVHSSSGAAGLLAQLRLSFYQNVDFGFQGGFTRQDINDGHTTTVRLGTDFKVALARADQAHLVSISVGAAIGVESGDDWHIMSLGPTAVVSRTLRMSESSTVTPYGRLGLAFSSIDVGTTSDSDLSFPLRFGGDFRLGPQLGIAVELQLQVSDSFNDDVGLAAGVNLPF